MQLATVQEMKSVGVDPILPSGKKKLQRSHRIDPTMLPPPPALLASAIFQADWPICAVLTP